MLINAKNRILLLVYCTLLSTSLLAYDGSTPYSLTYVNSNSGLPQNSVRSLLADKDGFLWVGTENGLSRFDGHSFINFSEIIPDIPEDVLMGIYMDSQNRIWTSWYKHSLRALLPNRTDVLVIAPADGYPEDLIDVASNVLEHTDGSIWFFGRQFTYRLKNTAP